MGPKWGQVSLRNPFRSPYINRFLRFFTHPTLGATCGRLSPLGSHSKGTTRVETDGPLGFCLPQCPLLGHVQGRCGRNSYRFLRYGAGSFVVGEGVGYSNDRAVAQSRRGLFALWF